MPDPAEQLQRLYLAGFELQTFERYPGSVGVIRDGCIALLRATPVGLEVIGTPGWRMGEVLGVLVEKDGNQVFQAKSEMVEATPERLEALTAFPGRPGAVANRDGVSVSFSVARPRAHGRIPLASRPLCKTRLPRPLARDHRNHRALRNSLWRDPKAGEALWGYCVASVSFLHFKRSCTSRDLT